RPNCRVSIRCPTPWAAWRGRGNLRGSISSTPESKADATLRRVDPSPKDRPVLPLKRPCRRDRGTARSGGNPSFSICQACDAHALKAVIYSLKPPHHPTLRLFPKCRWQVERQGDILIQGTAAPRSRGSPHGCSGVATGFGP